MDPQIAPAFTDVRRALSSATWTYRSFHNDVGLVNGDPSKALALIFGEGIITLRLEGDTVSGQLNMSSDYILDLQGQVIQDALVLKLDMAGKGRLGTPTGGWEYDYQAFLSPSWPTGVAQVPAFVGTVIRAVPHNGEPAGVTVSMIMLANPSVPAGPT